MRITVNGEPRDVPEGTTVETLVREIGAPLEAVVVERNREIVPRDRIGPTVLAEGDEIEVVRFVGGG